jgi:hypothetical protein
MPAPAQVSIGHRKKFLQQDLQTFGPAATAWVGSGRAAKATLQAISLPEASIVDAPASALKAAQKAKAKAAPKAKSAKAEKTVSPA